jgi:hypothetical protein
MTAKDNRPAAFKDDPHSHTIETLSTGRSLQVGPPALIITDVGQPLLKCSVVPQPRNARAWTSSISRLCLVRDLFFALIALPKADLDR